MIVVTGMWDCPQVIGQCNRARDDPGYVGKQGRPTAATSARSVQASQQRIVSVCTAARLQGCKTARLQPFCKTNPIREQLTDSQSVAARRPCPNTKCGGWASPTCQTQLLHTFLLYVGEHLIRWEDGDKRRPLLFPSPADSCGLIISRGV